MSKYSGPSSPLEPSNTEVFLGIVFILALAAVAGALGVWMLA